MNVQCYMFKRQEAINKRNVSTWKPSIKMRRGKFRSVQLFQFRVAGPRAQQPVEALHDVMNDTC